jgi:hypothetical protein
MKDSLIIAVVLVTTLFVAFIATTIISDIVCKQNGYYQVGKNEEMGLYE